MESEESLLLCGFDLLGEVVAGFGGEAALGGVGGGGFDGAEALIEGGFAGLFGAVLPLLLKLGI